MFRLIARLRSFPCGYMKWRIHPPSHNLFCFLNLANGLFSTSQKNYPCCICAPIYLFSLARDHGDTISLLQQHMMFISWGKLERTCTKSWMWFNAISSHHLARKNPDLSSQTVVPNGTVWYALRAELLRNPVWWASIYWRTATRKAKSIIDWCGS